MKRALFLVAMLAWLTGCGSTAGGPQFRPEVVEPGSSVIYVFRTGGGPSRLDVKLDQSPAGTVARGGYVAVVTSPGRHLVAVGPSGAAVREVTVGRDESVYLRVSDGPFKSTRLDVLDTAEGRSQIAGSHKSE